MKRGLEFDIPVFAIGTVAKLVGVHEQTLRLYEKEGLIKPHRGKGGRRMYSQRDLQRIQYICYLTQERKVNIQGVKVILELLEQKGEEDYEC